mgnify:CR=1 FL=1
MRQHYHEQLQEVSGHLVEMGRLVETAMEQATRSLLNADLALAETVISQDARIDEMAKLIDERDARIVSIRNHFIGIWREA